MVLQLQFRLHLLGLADVVREVDGAVGVVALHISIKEPPRKSANVDLRKAAATLVKYWDVVAKLDVLAKGVGVVEHGKTHTVVLWVSPPAQNLAVHDNVVTTGRPSEFKK